MKSTLTVYYNNLIGPEVIGLVAYQANVELPDLRFFDLNFKGHQFVPKQ